MSKYVKINIEVSRPADWDGNLKPADVREFFTELLDELIKARTAIDGLTADTIKQLTNSKPH